MTAEKLMQELQQRDNGVTALTALWKSGIDGHCPDTAQFGVWLNIHSFNIVQYGIRETARKFFLMKKNMDAEFLVKFASKVMNAEHSRKRNTQAA